MSNRPKRKQVVAPDWEDNDDIKEQLQEIIENPQDYTNNENDKVTMLQLAQTLSPEHRRLRYADLKNNPHWQQIYRIYVDMYTEYHNPKTKKKL